MRGLARFDARDFAAALEEFRGSYQLRASPNSRLYVARTLRELNQLPAAATEYETCVQEAREHASTDSRYRATQDAAQAELDAINARIGRVRVTVVSAPRQYSVRINNGTIPTPALALALPVAPGTVTITGEALGNAPVTASVTVAAGATEAVQLVFAADAQQRQDAASASTGGATPGADPRDSGSMSTGEWVARGRSPLRYLMFASLGVGVAAMGVGAGLAASASAAHQGLTMRCGTTACPASELGAIDGGRAMQTGANVSFAIGATGLVAGAVLLIVGPRTERAAPRVAVIPGAQAASVTMTGVF